MKKHQLIQIISIFAALLISGVLMILLPFRIVLDQPEVETILQESLPQVGSALLGAGLVFFLLEMTQLQRGKLQLIQTISIFAALLVSGLLMIFLPFLIILDQPEGAAILQNSLPLVGSALLGAGLVFFLLEMMPVQRNRTN